ncbi:MAG TPA: hypothetical protein VIZ90_03610 [Rhizobiaceae bacterium]
MRLLIISASVMHMRLANWHFACGEALLWRYRAMSDPRRPKMTPADFMGRALLAGLAIAGLWCWLAWRAS